MKIKKIFIPEGAEPKPGCRCVHCEEVRRRSHKNPNKAIDFNDYLGEQLKDPKFRKIYMKGHFSQPPTEKEMVLNYDASRPTTTTFGVVKPPKSCGIDYSKDNIYDAISRPDLKPQSPKSCGIEKLENKANIWETIKDVIKTINQIINYLNENL